MNRTYDPTTSLSSSEEMPIAQLTIYADEAGLIYFACDWNKDPEAIDSMADIFYKLDRKNLMSEILQDLQAQCVLENKEDIFQQMVSLINARIASDEDNTDTPEVVAVSPKNVTKL